jgi:hypothetical protein
MLTPAKAFLRRSTAGPGLGNRKHQQKRINNPKGSKGCVYVSGNEEIPIKLQFYREK